MKRPQRIAPELVLSVRSLLRHPDPISEERDAQGAVPLHRKVQATLRRKYKSFRAEVLLCADYSVRGKRVRVRGRADGLHQTRGGWKLIEIKPDVSRFFSELDLLEPQEQIRYYAALAQQSLTARQGEREIKGEIWLVKPSGRVRKVSVSLEDAAQRLFNRLEIELDIRRDRREHSAALKKVWPSVARKLRADFRPAQLEMSKGLSDAIAESSFAVLVSPPGTGKTRAVLWAGLNHAIAKETPLVYFTAKTTGAQEALETLHDMRNRGMPLRIVWLLGREQLCQGCFDWPSCGAILLTRQALVRGEVSAFLARELAWEPETLRAYSFERQFCLYELNREAARVADVIVADEFFFFEGLPVVRKKPFALLDEVHEVPQRLREHMEIFFSMEEMRSLARRDDWAGQSVKGMLQQLDPNRMESWEITGGIQEEWGAMAKAMRAFSESGSSREQNGTIGKLKHIARWLSSVPNEVCLIPMFHSGRFQGLHLSVIRESPILRRLLENLGGAIGFSGTLSGSDQNLRRTIGFPASSAVLRVGTLESGKVKILVIREGKSRHPPRLDDFKKAVRVLLQVMKLRPGVYLVFGQSNAYIQELSVMLRSRGVFSLEASRDLNKETMQHFFGDPAAKGFLFAALGGRFSEAVNLPVNLFAGVIVLGPGVSPPTSSSEFRRQLLETEDEDSFDEIYIQPAMARVAQAVGRLTRSPEARGVALLIDERFAAEKYMRHFPPEWYEKSPRELICANWKQVLRHA
ncbi:MAG: helicase C-terminal domain-containing protein [bacterium]